LGCYQQLAKAVLKGLLTTVQLMNIKTTKLKQDRKEIQ
jgi:hypothetical protein